MWQRTALSALCLMGSVISARADGAGTTGGGRAEPEAYRFDSLEVVAIQDAPNASSFAMFRGRGDERMRALVPGGSVPGSFNVFLIRKDGRLILIDAGNGGAKGSLLPQLKKLGVEPERIEAVLLTHMHGDHVGGLLTKNGTAAFPNAVVRVSVPEKEYWEKNENAALQKKVFRTYGDRIRPFRFGEKVECGILARDASGHTPGHAIFEIGNVEFIGDLMHGADLQFPDPGIYSVYDLDPAKATAIRRRTLKSAAEKKKVLAGAHLPQPGIFFVREMEDGGFARIAPERNE